MEEIKLKILQLFLLSFTCLSLEASATKSIIQIKKLQLPSGAFWIDNHWRDVQGYSNVPYRWRYKTSNIKDFDDVEIQINKTGLDNLFISGSANPTLANMLWLKKTYGAKHPVYIIDLRQETHLFINGLPISIFYKKNQINWGKSSSQINAEEQAWVNQLVSAGKIILNKSGKPIAGLKVPTNPITLNILEANTEEETARKAGLGYFRIPVPDYHPPTPAQVDQFLIVIKNIPLNSWIHIHCAAGKGRTTTFMVMADIVANGKTVKLNDIVARQTLLGGTDLFGTSKSLISQPWKNEYHKARVDYIKLFYTYIHSGAYPLQNFSSWMAKQPVSPYKLLTSEH